MGAGSLYRDCKTISLNLPGPTAMCGFRFLGSFVSLVH